MKSLTRPPGLTTPLLQSFNPLPTHFLYQNFLVIPPFTLFPSPYPPSLSRTWFITNRRGGESVESVTKTLLPNSLTIGTFGLNPVPQPRPSGYSISAVLNIISTRTDCRYRRRVEHLGTVTFLIPHGQSITAVIRSIYLGSSTERGRLNRCSVGSG